MTRFTTTWSESHEASTKVETNDCLNIVKVHRGSFETALLIIFENQNRPTKMSRIVFSHSTCRINTQINLIHQKTLWQTINNRDRCGTFSTKTIKFCKLWQTYSTLSHSIVPSSIVSSSRNTLFTSNSVVFRYSHSVLVASFSRYLQVQGPDWYPPKILFSFWALIETMTTRSY